MMFPIEYMENSDFFLKYMEYLTIGQNIHYKTFIAIHLLYYLHSIH